MANLDSAESLGDIVTQMEKNDEWWENALDQYENYTYHIELFIVNQKDAQEFLLNEQDNIETIISNGWPRSDMKYITIAETGATTEFNLQDLQVQSYGAGSNSVSKLSGTATKLSFSIVQVGETNLNDNLMNAALLSGYSSISECKFFIKINFKGYDEHSGVMRTETQNLTKVLPFVISNVSDVPTSTDARGTVTTIEGVISPDVSTSKSINLLQHNFEFEIKDTLGETLEEFMKILNETIRKNDFSVEDANNNPYIHDYKLEFDRNFETRFLQSMMNSDDPNTGSGSNEVKSRTGSINVGKQTGVVAPGMSIINILYDICIQSLDIKEEMTKENDTFTLVPSIMPNAVPKLGGLNVLTGEAGHDVVYYITTKKHIVIQNNYDNANKIKNSGQIIKDIFDNNMCKKVYYYQYTGMNDQILDFQMGLNRQLVKAYNMPTDNAYVDRFIDLIDGDILDTLEPRAKAEIQRLRQEQQALEGDRNSAVQNLDQLRASLENDRDAIVSQANDAIMENVGMSADGVALQESIEQNPSEVLNILASVDPEEALRLSEELESINATTKELMDEQARLRDITNNIGNLSAREELVLQQQIEARISELSRNNTQNINNSFVDELIDTDRILLEDISDELISSLTKQQLEDIVEALLINPVIFKRTVLPAIYEGNTTKVFISSDEEKVDLAKQKFYEAINMDISMQRVDMEIKGDPYWIDTYLTPKVMKDLFGDSNALDDYRSHPVSVNGANYIVIVVNKAAGVDVNDNTKIANLATMLYVVRAITSSFSGGLFTQSLELIRLPVPESFIPVNPLLDAEVDEVAAEETVMQQPVIQDTEEAESSSGTVRGLIMNDTLRATPEWQALYRSFGDTRSDERRAIRIADMRYRNAVIKGEIDPPDFAKGSNYEVIRAE